MNLILRFFYRYIFGKTLFHPLQLHDRRLQNILRMSIFTDLADVDTIVLHAYGRPPLHPIQSIAQPDGNRADAGADKIFSIRTRFGMTVQVH